jgi:ethanolamine utilization microcompartment shell protein EutL
MLRAYLFMIGLVLLAFGVLLALKSANRRARSVRTKGEVVGAVTHTDLDSQTYFFARIAFAAHDGGQHEFVSRVGSACEPLIGKPLQVIYEIENPSSAAEDTIAAQWGFPLGLGFLGAVSLGAALIL